MRAPADLLTAQEYSTFSQFLSHWNW